MSHNLNKMLSLAEKIEKIAIEKIQPLHVVKQWTISYFPTQEEAESVANPDETVSYVENGWLLTKDGNIFKDQDDFSYTANEIELIEKGKATPATIKRLRKENKEKTWKAAEQLKSLLEIIRTAKLDPKAKVRNRGTVCVPAERAKDKKDHFPINNIDQARNALSRVNQFSKVPDWYKGSLQSLINTVVRKVKSKYPSIDVTKESSKPGKKKSSLDSIDIVKIAKKYDALRKMELEEQLRIIRKQLSKLNIAKEIETNNSSLKKIKNEIEMLKSDKLGIELELEKLQSEELQETELEQARPMSSLDSPYDYFAGGAADDGEV